MKKFSVLFICIVGFLSFQNCSSVKVLDSWKSDSVSNVKQNNFLVVARTDNKQARVAFENEIVNEMLSKGYKATASFTKFPSMNPDEKMTEAKQKQIKQLLENEGFDGVVLTVLKDLKEETRLVEEGGYYAGGNYFGYYPRYYGRFYNYFSHPMAMSTLGNYVPASTTEYTSKVYVVETTVYDLKATGENQLIAVVTSKIDNPESVSTTAKDYVSKITKSLQ